MISFVQFSCHNMKKYWLIAIMFLPVCAHAQIISTIAGQGTGSADGIPATAAHIYDPVKGVFDRYGNYYFVSCLAGNMVKKIDVSEIITTIAGDGTSGYNGDGIPATSAHLKQPNSAILDTGGNIYIAEGGNNRVRRVDKLTGIITTYAGNGVGTFGGDGGPATAASLNDPQDLCFDRQGNLYISDYGNNKVRKVTPSGIISTFAGNGISGYSPDGVRADTSRLGGVVGLTIDADENIYIADIGFSRIYKVNNSGIITTVVGTGTGHLYNGDNLPALSANIDPNFIFMDKYGNLWISEVYNYRVRMVDKSGVIRSIVGNGIPTSCCDGGLASAASLSYPAGIAFDSCDNLYVPETDNGHIRKISFQHCHYLDVAEDGGYKSSIYPNPATNELNISYINQPSAYRLLNVTGACLQQGNLRQGTNTLSLQDIAAGVYILELKGEDGQKQIFRVLHTQ